MSDAPKIVKDRLRAATPRDAHPEADVLTAFAEQGLSGAEREGVMRHLARCGDCREVVALSIPPSVESQPEGVTETPVRQRTESPRAWFAWPQLRWAGMAAAVVVVASVVMLRTEKQSETSIVVAPPAPSLQNQAAGALSEDRSLAPSDSQRPQAGRFESDRPDNKLRNENRDVDLARSLPSSIATPLASATPAAVKGVPESDSVDTRYGNAQRGAQLGMQAPTAPAAVNGGVAGSSQDYTYQANSTNGAPGDARSVEKLSTRNDAPARPIQKTKDAAKEESDLKSPMPENELAGRSMLAATELDSTVSRAKKQSKFSKNAVAWSLAQGRLQRSLDSSASWQVVLQLQQPLLSFGALGSEVWAGGQSGVLAHSTNGGAVWTMIHPATKTETLAGDIIAIEVRSATEIVLSTSGHESWATTDAGVTWEKK